MTGGGIGTGGAGHRRRFIGCHRGCGIQCLCHWEHGPGPSGVMSPKLPGLSRPDSTSSPIRWRRVENEAKLAFSQVAIAEWMLHDTLVSVHHNIFHPIQDSLRKRKTNDPVHTPSAFLCAHLNAPCIAPQLLSRGSADTTVLQVEVARALEVITIVEAARVAAAGIS
jgi:hypothetical protein